MWHTVQVIGHLGRDPESCQTAGGEVVRFSVATTRRWTGQDGQQREETVWFQVSAFGKLAEVCRQHLTRGRLVLVEGRLQPDEGGNPCLWTGQDGQPRTAYDLVADNVVFLDSPRGERENG
jgi:single-strand DNA-binding protein